MKYTQSPLAEALRAAGYVPLPRLWVRPKDMPRVHEIAFVYADEINTIRAMVKEETLKWEAENRKSSHNPDAQYDRDAAWAEYEKMLRNPL
jgi:hypothetical protein